MVARFLPAGALSAAMISPLVPTQQCPPEVLIPYSAANQRDRFSEAYTVLEQAIDRQAFPGAAFSVLEKKEIVAIDGVGQLTYQRGAPSVTAATFYDLASITKVLATTSMAMLLYQRGLFALDQPIVDLLPGFAQGEPQGSPRHKVTGRMLLAHSSGLAGYARLFESCRDRDSVLAACLRLPLEAEPGRRAEYSDLGFILLGRILENLAGESLESFCEREVFSPLGMSSTCFRPPASWASAIAPTEEDLSFRHRILQGEVQDENCFVLGGSAGHAGLFSNALDPLRYVQCMLNDDPELFLPATIQLFTTRSELPPGSSRALGWDTPSPPSSSGRFFSRRSAGHLGYTGTSLWIDFERQLAITLLTNRTWPQRESDAIRQVRPAFHNAILDAILKGLGHA
jgi:serine-type D-Ala-D-Ala carboxypeptidase